LTNLQEKLIIKAEAADEDADEQISNRMGEIYETYYDKKKE
jgi:hypothetical protein